jgi:ribose transport system permease protein
MAASAMLATAIGGPFAIPIGLGIGLAIGLFNGIGVAYLRVPSMIFTLGVNVMLRGAMVMLTGGFSPSSVPTDAMLWIAKGDILGVPNPVIVWVLVSIAVAYMLRRMPLGRYIYAIGNREAAVYLSGVNTRLVVVAGFALCSTLAALAGILLAGYSSKAFQAMGDPYLLPSIAAVVIGGTNILGGSGPLLRHGRRNDPHRPPPERAVGHADARGGPADHLRHRHHRDAAGLRARRAAPGVGPAGSPRRAPALGRDRPRPAAAPF